MVLAHQEHRDPKRLVMIDKPIPEALAKGRAPTTGTEDHALRSGVTGLMLQALDPDLKAAKDLQERHKPMDHPKHPERTHFTMRIISPGKMPTWGHTMA